MKMKRGKAGKKTKPRTKRKGSVSSDDELLPVSTSLPPAVEGQLRCFLSLSVSKLTWSVDKHPTDVQIRICWWGEQGQGTLLCPSRGQDTLKVIDSSTKWNSVRYPVCSGPKQFAAYLNDMGTLLLETVHSSTQIPFGKALISEIAKLTASHPINVTVPIMSVISPFNKLADIQVYIKFESVSAAYNKLSSSIPTIDTGLDKENVDISNPQPTPPPYLNPATPVSHPRQIKGLNDPFESPAPKKGVKFSEKPPEKLEYTIEPSLLSLLANNQGDTSEKHSQDDNLFKTDHKTEAQVTSSDEKPVDTARDEVSIGQTMNPEISTDWIGALLERGQRLRDGLALSTLLEDNSSESFIEHFNSPQRHVPPGRLLKEILHKEESSNMFDSVPKRVTTSPDRAASIDSENKLIDLLMGEQHDFMDNISTLSDVSQEHSEIGDPVYDESLLMDLFYKSQQSKSTEEDTFSTEGEFDSTLTNGSLEEDLEDKHNRSKQRCSSPKHHIKKMKSQYKKSKIKELTVENDDNESSAEHPWELSDEQAICSITSSGSSCDLVVEQLGIDILTTLGRVNTARVMIDRLELTDYNVIGGVNNGESKKPRTYFVEYSFPITTTKEADKPTVASEITRVASKKIQEKAVLFNHRSVFPVLFNASVVEHWFKAGMQFKIFMRDSGQRQPTEVGAGIFKLKSVLVSSDLTNEAKVDIKEHVRHHDTDKASLQSFETSPSSAKSQQNTILGNLEVKIELGVDGKAVHVAPMPASQPNIPSTTAISMVSRPVVISCSQSQSHQHKTDRLSSKPPLPHTSSKQVPAQEEKTDFLTLHSLLWIQEGKNITLQPHDSRDNQVPGISERTNLFLVSRMFWCEEVTKSPVCWGTNHPQFGFKQIAPVLLSPTLLERTCNNFMVVEVWDRVIPQGEKLVGIVKLPLHQLYLSYRDPKITKTLMKSKFPVVCIDDMLPVSSPFTAACHGELKVLLAIGTEEQISSLLNVKDGNNADSPRVNLDNRPLHHLDQQRQSNANNSRSPPRKTVAIDHHFEITVGDIRGLSVFNSTVWGETDCYVQYLFPQQHQTTEYLDVEAVPGLKTHQTPTTLCVPDPSFQDVTRHSFVLPSGVPVQRYLVAAYSGSWTSGQSSVPGSGGVPFELWRRYYYPNVRDQLVAKASLPVAKLCAMVTMQRHREPSIQSFSLPLMVLPDDKSGAKQDSGLLEITVKYHASNVQPDDQTKNFNDQVNLSVDVIRACGLKDAAMTHIKSNPTMSYPADVGINAYVIIKLPVGRKKRYVTRTVARTFAPEFSHHLDITAPLQMPRNSLDDHDQRQLGLAEKLEMTEAVFELWHQHSRGVGNIGSHGEQHRENDIPLGVVTIPLSELLICRTGISGWYAIKPFDTNTNINHDSVIGGLQLSIKFDDPEDREAVIHEGRRLGWSPPPGIEYDDNNQLFDLEDDDDDFPKGLELDIKINRAWVPALLLQEYHGNVNSIKEIKGYIRYKLYDKSPLCSRVVTLKHHDKEASIFEVKHSKRFILPATTSLIWYLREESLEAQVWIRGKTRKDKDDGTVLPGRRDKLVGSAFIHLSSLVVPGLKNSQISGEFPLFKAGADAMEGARIHVQLSLSKPNTHSRHLQMDEQEELNDSLSSDEYPSTKGFVDNDSTSFKSSSDQQPNDDAVLQTPPKSTPSVPDDSFAAHVIIQEAHHLTTVLDRNGDRVPPDVYVSYQVSPSSSTTTTPVVKANTKPVWEFQKLEHLPLSSLKTQNLVFKVWHQSDLQKDQGLSNKHFSRKSDRPESDGYNIGFASVDLSPLAAGLRQLIGWYNITDFNGQCKGQIKVGIVPLAPVSPSRCLSRSRLHTSVPPVAHTDKPFLSRFSDSAPSLLGRIAIQSEPEPLPHTRAIDSVPSMNGHQETSTREQIGLPTATSSSFLFRQLRQNMQDLDHLQKGLQAKLTGISAGDHDNQGQPYPRTGDMSANGLYKPSTEAIQLTAQRNESKASSASSFLWSESILPKHDDFNNEISNIVKQTDLIKEQEDLDLDSQLSDDFQQVKLKEQDDIDMNSQLASDMLEAEIEEENLSSKDVLEEQANCGTEREPVFEKEANIRDEKVICNEIGNFDDDDEKDTGNDEKINEKDPSHDSDALEEVSLFEKPNCKPSLPFDQEIDSWLSSGDEEEQKSPVTALAFTLPDKEPNTYPQKFITHTAIVDDSSTFLPGDVVKADIDSESEITEAMNLFNDKPTKQFVINNNYHEDACMSSDDELKTSESFNSHNCRSNNNNNCQEGFTNQHLKEQISNESKDKYSAIPNFFMHTQDLENSMRALRLGAKLGYPRKLTCTLPESKLLERTCKSQENQDADGIISQYSRREVVYKAKQDMQPPLSSNEIDRIAKIFSSKQK